MHEESGRAPSQDSELRRGEGATDADGGAGEGAGQGRAGAVAADGVDEELGGAIVAVAAAGIADAGANRRGRVGRAGRDRQGRGGRTHRILDEGGRDGRAPVAGSVLTMHE